MEHFSCCAVAKGSAQVEPPLPRADDPLLAPFWAATSTSKIVVRRCAECGRLQWPPQPRCSNCLRERFSWQEIRPEGTLYSYFIARRSFHPSFAESVPYAVAIVSLSDGVRMIGRLVGVEPDEIVLDQPVSALFHEVAPKLTLVYWTPSAGAPSA